jgi:hypothetical protein
MNWPEAFAISVVALCAAIATIAVCARPMKNTEDKSDDISD